MPKLSSDDVTRPVLLTSLPLDGWELSEPKTVKALKILNLTHAGVTPITRLADGIKLTMPFAPTTFGGGTGERKGCLVTINEELADYLTQLEGLAKAHLAETAPKIENIWTTAVRRDDHFPPSLRCKINTSGLHMASFYKEDGELAPEPEDWRQLPVNVCIVFRGVYLQKTCAGLLIDVTHLQYAPHKTFSPF